MLSNGTFTTITILKADQERFEELVPDQCCYDESVCKSSGKELLLYGIDGAVFGRTRYEEILIAAKIHYDRHWCDGERFFSGQEKFRVIDGQNKIYVKYRGQVAVLDRPFTPAAQNPIFD